MTRARSVAAGEQSQWVEQIAGPASVSAAGPCHIVVAGTMAAGKTTLTAGLSEALKLPAYVEEPHRNPFLERFYRDPTRWALPSLLWFVSDTAHQHAEIHERGGGVQDHSFYENVNVFGPTMAAEGKLRAEEWELLREVSHAISAHLPPPALVLLIEAPVNVLLARIASRGRVYEAEVDSGYLEALSITRRDFFRAWRASPVLRIDSALVDLRDQSQIDAIAAVVLNRLSPARFDLTPFTD